MPMDEAKLKKNIFIFFIISHPWDVGSWNYSPWMTGICLSYIVNTITADGLATQGAKASATMALTNIYIHRNIPVST